MSPPQDRAASSGWGATKTWVMAGRVYRAGRSLRAGSIVPAGLAHERHEHHRPVVSLDPLVASAHDEDQLLVRPAADRDHEAAAVLIELAAERLGDRGRGGRHDDSIPRRAGRVAEAAVTDPDRDRAAEVQARDALAGGLCELRMTLDRGDLAAEEREYGRLVAGAGADLQDALAGSRGEQLGHPPDDVRLADRLARLNRERLVGVGEAPPIIGDEQLSRDGAHRPQDPLVADAPGPKLPRDHGGAGLGFGARVTLAGHARQDTPRRGSIPASSGVRTRMGSLAPGSSLAVGSPLVVRLHAP